MKSTCFFRIPALLLAATMMFSCSDDDENTATPEGLQGEGEFTYNGTEYEVSSAAILDVGAEKFYPSMEENSHYTYFIHLGDGEYTRKETASKPGTFYVDGTNKSYEVFLYLRSPSTDAFEPGYFTIPDFNQLNADNVGDKFIVMYADLWFDQNSNGVYDSDSETLYIATEGYVNVVRDGDGFGVRYDLKLDNGETLTGKYTGEFFVAKSK